MFTIGELAHRTGVPVRTIRFWSDSGLVPPAARSAGGFRLYDAAAAARLDLVRTLRELDLPLDAVERILAGTSTVADVARRHAQALDAEIRLLRVRRAVLRAVARSGGGHEEMRYVHEMARLSAAERQRVIDEFVEATFAGLPADSPGAGIAEGMRQLPAQLPDDPTPEQVDAWVELAGLVADEDFRARVRQMAVTGAAGSPPPADQPDPDRVVEHAGAAAAAGIAPESAAGREVLDRIVDPALPAAQRRELADRIAAFTDARVERYWQLIGVLNGREPFAPAVAAFEWLVAALRAQSTST
jgi:DNA-binding transcriptional MerR regulator